MNPEKPLSTPDKKAVFTRGQEVVVHRNPRDDQGNRIPGEVTFEGGWTIKGYSDAEHVVVGSPDGSATKVYSVERLESYQPTDSEVDSHAIEAARNLVEARQDLGVEATEHVVEDPSGTEIDYDAFLHGTGDEGSVEAAAVRPAETEEERLTRERRNADLEDAAHKAYLQNKSFKSPE